MGYYYNDPTGLASWWVDDGEQPAQALARWQETAGLVVDDRVIISQSEQQLAPQAPAVAPAPPRPSGGGGGVPTPVGPPALEKVPAPPAFAGKALPEFYRSPLTLVPTGEPVSTGILTVIVTISVALWKLFGGGVSRAVKNALEGMRRLLIDGLRELLQFVLILARAIGRLYLLVKQLYDRVIEPLFRQVAVIMQRLDRLLNRILRPYLDFMQRVRAQLLRIYDRYFRPTIEVIQMMRQAIAILRLAHVPFAKSLDEKLVRLQAKIMAPILALLERTNEHSGLLNILMRVDMVLKRSVFLGAMQSYRHSWISQWWNEQTPDAIDLGQVRRPPPDSSALAQIAIANFTLYASTGGGPLARPIAVGIAAFGAVTGQIPRRPK